MNILIFISATQSKNNVTSVGLTKRHRQKLTSEKFGINKANRLPWIGNPGFGNETLLKH